jgi:hypothetical protein
MRSAPSRRHVLAVVLALVAAVLATLAPGAAAGPSSARVAAAEPLLSSQFRTPPAAVRPKIRWWWSGDYDPEAYGLVGAVRLEPEHRVRERR